MGLSAPTRLTWDRYHAKDDKEAIAAWKSELNRILHVFDVCYFASTSRLLTVRFKAELGMSARTTASGTRKVPVNEPTVAPDICRGRSKSRVVGSQPVSIASAPLVTD